MPLCGRYCCSSSIRLSRLSCSPANPVRVPAWCQWCVSWVFRTGERGQCRRPHTCISSSEFLPHCHTTSGNTLKDLPVVPTPLTCRCSKDRGRLPPLRLEVSSLHSGSSPAQSSRRSPFRYEGSLTLFVRPRLPRPRRSVPGRRTRRRGRPAGPGPRRRGAARRRSSTRRRRRGDRRRGRPLLPPSVGR